MYLHFKIIVNNIPPKQNMPMSLGHVLRFINFEEDIQLKCKWLKAGHENIIYFHSPLILKHSFTN